MVGLIGIPGGKLTLVFNVKKAGNDYTTTMDSPDQGMKDLPISRTTFENKKTITFEFPEAKITYKGDLDASGKFIGNFTQGNNSLPLSLNHAAPPAVQKPNRPQEPKTPFPYYSEEVTFQNKKENFTLAGTLTLPKKEGNFPVVVLITGSEPKTAIQKSSGTNLSL
ncbi:hypothetical protein [Flavobacterium sp. 3HN19-14]|uniref:hypothetical protein n=1 Tax=Flavobacterium sp. 3HN19-14 TaxID=3448133 RepID=UPI003EE10CEF